MRLTSVVKILTLAVCGAVQLAQPAWAEDTKGKWQFGVGLSYMSTVDYIRSNADTAFASGPIGDNGLPGVGFVDNRPDANVLNKPSIQDDFKLDMHASYGLTRWLAIEFAVGHMKAPVGNIEFYLEDQTNSVQQQGASTALTGCGPDLRNLCTIYSAANDIFTTRTNSFLPVGNITEIPVQLSALVRFRPESPFDPYVGLGGGRIFTDLKTGKDFQTKSALVQSLQVQNASEGEIVVGTATKLGSFPGFTPGPLTATVKDSWEWHAVGGVDYYVNEHFSFYVDARYIWTSGAVDIRADGAHSVLMPANDFGILALKTNPGLWEDKGFTGCVFNGKDCSGDGYFETADGNSNGKIDTAGCTPGVVGPCEGSGKIYVFKPGPGAGGNGIPTPSSPGDLVGFFTCTGCTGPPSGYTEDRNQNGLMDRFLYYGQDICSTQEGAGNPKCATIINQGASYVWPEGGEKKCAQHPSSTDFPAEGCPPPPPTNDHLTSTGDDNAVDKYSIQGGRIKLGGFSLGFGIKFTF